jgi:hypothetical protein
MDTGVGSRVPCVGCDPTRGNGLVLMAGTKGSEALPALLPVILYEATERLLFEDRLPAPPAPCLLPAPGVRGRAPLGDPLLTASHPWPTRPRGFNQDGERSSGAVGARIPVGE